MMFRALRQFFAAAPHRPRLPETEVFRQYPRFRWRVMESTFLGYAAFYLVRNNLSVVSKDLEQVLYNKSQVGDILAALAVSYGLGKFVMGTLSDRSNPRTFMATGLLLTAACNFAFGAADTYWVHLLLWSLNGFVQGMGWPPCGRAMGHWFSYRERGLTFSIWNTSHNLGGGLAGVIAGWAAASYGGWQYAFYVPGALALIGAVYILVRLCDTPQSVGLPPIEEYWARRRLRGVRCGHGFAEGAPDRCPVCGQSREQAPPQPEPPVPADVERELTFRELLVDKVLTNRFVWILAAANFFAYVSRYSMLDWGPMYLREMKGATLHKGGLAVLMLEFGGIPSTILLGWVSDLVAGRRGTVATLAMVPILAAFATILYTPAGWLWLDMAMLVAIGFFVYPVINFIVIMALDLTSKKAIGTAAGFIGLFGYIGRTAQAKGFGWLLHHLEPQYGTHVAWAAVFYAILACSALAAVLLALTWRVTGANRPTPAETAASEEPVAAA